MLDAPDSGTSKTYCLSFGSCQCAGKTDHGGVAAGRVREAWAAEADSALGLACGGRAAVLGGSEPAVAQVPQASEGSYIHSFARSSFQHVAIGHLWLGTRQARPACPLAAVSPSGRGGRARRPRSRARRPQGLAARTRGGRSPGCRGPALSLPGLRAGKLGELPHSEG